MTCDYLQFRLNSLIHYQLPTVEPRNRKLPDITKKAYSGQVGINAAKRIRRAIEIMAIKSPRQIVYSYAAKKNVEFWLSFVTLTIPSHVNVNHKEAVKVLALWLLQMKRIYGILYVWKAELQKRGQIHFHICLNKFIEWREIRNRWNRQLKKKGWMNEYYTAKGHYNANSTDVKHVREAHEIGAYLSKYVSKKGAAVDCKVWDCSAEIRGKKYYATEMVAENIQNIDLYDLDIVRLETCSVIKCAEPKIILTKAQRHEYDNAW